MNWRFPLAVALLGSGELVHAQSLPDIKDLFQNELACALVEPLLAQMPVEPLFLQQGTDCVATVPDEQAGLSYFADDQCRVPVDFTPTSLRDHCAVLLDASLLGEGDGAMADTWTLPPGARMDVGARSLDGVNQPYLQRSIYRTVATARGECDLEMRVYSRHPQASGQQSLLALHGGSWSARGFGFFGLELTIPHFVNQGFVVYAPFYRLLGESDGSVACNGATITEVVEDAEAALLWVQNNASTFGSAATPVVFGQSAGAHLATSLAVNKASDVSAAVLFYPPTDFTDFALRVQGGFYTNAQGLGILERVIGSSADAADISASPIVENSFPLTIVEQDLSVPPVFMLHGMADDLVEPRQSVRLCEAIARTTLTATEQSVPVPAGLSEIRACGADSSLQLVTEGLHALDVCFAGTFLPTDLCPSGSEDSRQVVSESIGSAVAFATMHAELVDEQPTADPNEPATDPPSSNSSGGSVSFWLAGLLGLVQVLMKFRQRGNAHICNIRPGKIT